MKSFRYQFIMLFIVALSGLLSACSNDEDSRSYEPVSVVGVKVDGTLYQVNNSGDSAIVNLASGVDLSSVKLQLLIANGTAPAFVNDNTYDARRPIDLSLKGYDGTTSDVKLCVRSAPKLTSLSIARLDVPAGNVYTSSKSVIVQVDPGTDLTALAVTMEFTNGTLSGFENGTVRDYTNPVSFSVLGVDGITVYPYQLIITTDPVGPATIKSMTINGLPTTKVEVSGTTVTPYVGSLTDLSSATVTIQTGYGNEIDPSFSGQGLNLLSGNNKVTITGTNGQPTEFTIATPQLDPEVMFIKSSAELGFNGNDLGSVGFSGSCLLTTHTAGTKAPVWFDLSGNQLGQLSVKGCTGVSGFGFRKFATDDSGVILGSSLGMSSGEQWVYRWENVNADPTPFISFSKASLGTSYNPRAAGLNISGSLSGDATITMAMAQQADIFVWKVTNGTVGEPQKLTSPVKFGYYAAIQPLPDNKGYLIAATSSSLNGIIVTDSRLNELFRLTGMTMNDVSCIAHNNRIYMAYTVIVGSNKPTMRICDITDGTEASYKQPILNIPMKDQAANGNATTDSGFRVIDGKLYVAFSSTNSDLYLYKLEQ